MNTFVGPSGTGSVFVGSADHVEHTKHASISVDGGQVRIDATDDEHVIRIMHTTNDGIDILAALDKLAPQRCESTARLSGRPK